MCLILGKGFHPNWTLSYNLGQYYRTWRRTSHCPKLKPMLTTRPGVMHRQNWCLCPYVEQYHLQETWKDMAHGPLGPLQSLCLFSQSFPTLHDPMHCSPPGSSVQGDSPGKNTVVGCHALLQEIFPTQGSNTGLLHGRHILYHLSHQCSLTFRKEKVIKNQWRGSYSKDSRISREGVSTWSVVKRSSRSEQGMGKLREWSGSSVGFVFITHHSKNQNNHSCLSLCEVDAHRTFILLCRERNRDSLKVIWPRSASC